MIVYYMFLSYWKCIHWRVHTRRIENKKSMVVMTCMQHKTSAQGPTHLVFNKTTDQLLCKYYSLVCQRIQPKERANHLLFLTANGSRYSQVYRKLQEAIAVNNTKDIELPRPSQYRKVVRTDGLCSLTNPGLWNMSRHMHVPFFRNSQKILWIFWFIRCC